MPKPLAEHAQIQAIFDQGLRIFICQELHFFIIVKIMMKFRTFDPGR